MLCSFFVAASATKFSGAAASARRSDDGDSQRGSRHLFVCKWNVRYIVKVLQLKP